MEFVKKHRTLVRLVCLTLLSRAVADTVIVDSDVQNGNCQSNGSFEYTGSNVVGFWEADDDVQ